MIFRRYLELATPQQAKTWFATAPEQAPNVVPINVIANQLATKAKPGGKGSPTL
jgi:hypothetical protein